MKNELYIFGNGDLAEIAEYYFSKFSNYKIKGFIVDKQFLKETKFCSHDIYSSDDFLKFKTNNIKIFIALGYSNLNKIREDKYNYFKSLGYSFANYISEKATILNDYMFGENNFVLENNVIQPFVKIGNNVTIWSGNHIGHHSIIEDNVFISSHVVISGRVIVKKNTFIGVNSTLRDNIIIGNHSIIGAGSLILKNADSFSIYKEDNTIKSRIPSDKI